MKNQEAFFDVPVNGMEKEKSGMLDVDVKRVFARIIKYWYLIVLSVLATVFIAFFINRYSARIYPVRASIIILQSDENAGAKFLYDNELVNPFRNFYNEIYIMKSYPLLAEVMEELNFDVSYFREGNIKTTEMYDPNFPVEFEILGRNKPYGRSVNLLVEDSGSFSIELLFDEDLAKGQKRIESRFGDTVRINGFSLVLRKKGDVTDIVDRRFRVQFNDPYALARSYSNRLDAKWAQLGASVVNLEIQGEVPAKEVSFLNKFIEKYQEYDIEKKNKMATMALRFLDAQLRFMSDSLDLLENKVEDFKYENIITNLGGETNRLYLKAEALEEQKFQYRLKENYYKYISEILRNDQYDGIFTPSSVGVSDNVITALITSLINARAELNRYQGIERREENPLYREQIVRIKQIKSDILKAIENTRKTEAINIRFMEDQMKEINQALSKLPATERRLVDIQRDYSLKENLYVFLLQKKTEAGLSKASTTSDIVVVNPPIAGGHISPKERQNYLLALGLGLFLPLLGFVLAEMFNNKIQSKEDIEKISTVPFIGGIGHNAGDNQLIVHAKPRSAMAESFRAVRSNLNYFTGSKEHLVFMVTSSLPGEGKSFTALNLATVLAMAGKKTLIIGADMRRPKLYSELGLHNDFGLSQYLSGLMIAHEVIQTAKIENLFLVAGGPPPPNPSELLLRPLMDELIAYLRERFQYVIIDTPPLSFVADAFVLAKYADHSIFVVRQDFTPKSSVIQLEDSYQAGKLRNISVLFNDLRKTGPGYGYGYSYGYQYQSNGYGWKKQGKKDDSYYSD